VCFHLRMNSSFKIRVVLHLAPLLQIHYLMILSANWAYLKDASHSLVYQDIRLKEERELQDIQSRSKECLNSYS
uniref:Uncharacterized protein n=1 Tax=Cyprinus carpio TaxID=7962 RepID=A0A8C1N905_CYPCA